jgi:hypothetical protein
MMPASSFGGAKSAKSKEREKQKYLQFIFNLNCAFNVASYADSESNCI